MEWNIQNMKMEHKLMISILILIIISRILFSTECFYLLSLLLFFYFILGLLFSLILMLSIITSFYKTIIFVFLSFLLAFIPPISRGSMGILGFFRYVSMAELVGIIISCIVFIFSLWILLKFSDHGKNKIKLVRSTFLFFLICLFFILILSRLDIYWIDYWFLILILPLPFMLIVPTIIYFTYDKVVQKEPKEETIRPKEREKPLMKSCPFCGEKILVNSKFCSHCGKSLIPSGKLGRLLEKKTELKRQLEDLKEEKDSLISKKILSEKEYQKKYEEIMDKLVDIEDRIIKEKMKGGKKK